MKGHSYGKGYGKGKGHGMKGHGMKGYGPDGPTKKSIKHGTRPTGEQSFNAGPAPNCGQGSGDYGKSKRK